MFDGKLMKSATCFYMISFNPLLINHNLNDIVLPINSAIKMDILCIVKLALLQGKRLLYCIIKFFMREMHVELKPILLKKPLYW